MKKLILFGYLSLMLLVIGAAEKDRLAVMDVQDEAGLFNEKTIANVTDYIFTKLQETNLFLMIPMKDRNIALEQAIKETVKGSRKECVADECKMSMVAQLQANFLIDTKIKKLYEGTCNISISKFDVEKRAGVMSWIEKFNCTEKGLYETIDSFDFGGRKERGVSVKQDDISDKNACKYAKEKNDLEIWEKYIEKYPKGVCEFEAKIFLERNERSDNSNKTNYEDLYQQYLNKYNQENSENASKTEKSDYADLYQQYLNKYNKDSNSHKVTDLNWSKKAPNKMSWSDAKTYCANLNEDGYSDWRLPTISELRTLIKNCPATESGGACKITNECLSSKCRNDDCKGCKHFEEGRYSKLEDTDQVWSSSEVSDYIYYAWNVDFGDGEVIGKSFISHKVHFALVRCVR